MNNKLAIIIPGLTTCSSDKDALISCIKNIVGDFSEKTFYINTWDHQYNDITTLTNLLESNGYNYKLYKESYEQNFDNLINVYMNEKIPILGQTWDLVWKHKDIEFKRRHFAIYYKFFKSFHMTQDEEWILRVKPNNKFRLGFALEKSMPLIDAFLYNKTATTPDFSNTCNREFGISADNMKQENTMFCSIDGISSEGNTKINENAMFAHRRCFDSLFGNDMHIFLDQVFEIYTSQFLKNAEVYFKHKVDNFITPACGSLVWATLLTKNNIHIINDICYAGQVDKSSRRHYFY